MLANVGGHCADAARQRVSHQKTRTPDQRAAKVSVWLCPASSSLNLAFLVQLVSQVLRHDGVGSPDQHIQVSSGLPVRAVRFSTNPLPHHLDGCWRLRRMRLPGSRTLLGRARLQVPTDGDIDEILLHPAEYQPPEYVVWSLTSRKQLYYDVAVLLYRARYTNNK